LCGIFGFITDRPSEENLELFKELCYLSAMRGTDATGVAIVSGEKIIIDKAPIPSPRFIKERLPVLEKGIAKANIVIGHTRKWTQGKPSDNENNHPIHSPNWVMVHNGICSSMDRIKGYKYRGEVDSEILLSYVEKEGIEKGLPNLVGYAAVALIDKKKPNGLYLWRHNEGVLLGFDRDSETIFFGSTEEIMENGLANELLFFSSFQIKKLPEDNLYKFTHEPLCVEDLGELKIKSSTNYWWQNRHKKDKDEEDDDPKKGKLWAWDVKKGMMVPITADNTATSTAGNTTNLPAKLTNRYYFEKQSIDFVHWRKEGKYFISSDALLVKIWDKDKMSHFLMTFEDAVKEGVIDKSVLL